MRYASKLNIVAGSLACHKVSYSEFSCSFCFSMNTSAGKSRNKLCDAAKCKKSKCLLNRNIWEVVLGNSLERASTFKKIPTRSTNNMM